MLKGLRWTDKSVTQNTTKHVAIQAFLNVHVQQKVNREAAVHFIFDPPTQHTKAAVEQKVFLWLQVLEDSGIFTFAKGLKHQSVHSIFNYHQKKSYDSTFTTPNWVELYKKCQLQSKFCAAGVYFKHFSDCQFFWRNLFCGHVPPTPPRRLLILGCGQKAPTPTGCNPLKVNIKLTLCSSLEIKEAIRSGS